MARMPRRGWFFALFLAACGSSSTSSRDAAVDYDVAIVDGAPDVALVDGAPDVTLVDGASPEAAVDAGPADGTTPVDGSASGDGTAAAAGDALSAADTSSAEASSISDGTAGEALTIVGGDIDFGEPAICGEYPTKSVAVRNDGTRMSGTLTVTSATIFPIAEDTCTGKTLAPSASCLLTLSYRPVSPNQLDTGTLVVTSDAGGRVEAAVHGKASIPDEPFSLVPTENPASIVEDYGVVAVGATKTASFTVRSFDQFPIAAFMLVVSGADRAAFTITASDCGTRLSALGQCHVSVTFAPLHTQTLLTASLTFSAPCGTASVVLKGGTP
jgi:hypothetical protein